MSFREDAFRRAAGLFGIDLQKLSAAPIQKAAEDQPVARSIADLPAAWQSATFGPGNPIQPLPNTSETLIPREIDYPISVNASLQPRTGYGLMPFEVLTEAYNTVTEVRMPTSTIIRELCGFLPHLIDKDGNEVQEHPMAWLSTSPDRCTPFAVWLSRFLQSKNMYDAGALFVERNGSDLQALRYVDGSTLFLIVDEHGEMPRPDASDPNVRTSPQYVEKLRKWIEKHPDKDFDNRPIYKPGAMFHDAILHKAADGATILKTPAFAQVIKGVPFGWYSQDEIWYRPSLRRTNAPYGTSYIEQAWPWVITIANIVAFELAHYRTGNMPEGWAELPKDMFPTLDKIQAFELAFNQRMSTGATERMRQRFVPEGTKWHETKKAEFPEKLYERARDNISLLAGVPPSEYGKVPGQGLGGKGFADAMQSTLFRMGLMPNQAYVNDAINESLKRCGVDDVTFELALPTESTDPEKQKDTVKGLFAAGILTLNDALGELNMDKVDGGDIHIVVSGGTVIVLEDYLKGKRDNPPPVPGQPGAPGQPAVPGQPGGPAVPAKPEVVNQAVSETAGKGAMTPEDYQIVTKILESGELPDQAKYVLFTNLDKWAKGTGRGADGKWVAGGGGDYQPRFKGATRWGLPPRIPVAKPAPAAPVAPKGSNRIAGHIYGQDSQPIYLISDASKMMDENRLALVGIKGDAKGEIYATNGSDASHSSMLSGMDERHGDLDSYVHLYLGGGLSGPRAAGTISINTQFAGISVRDKESEIKAVDNIYTAMKYLNQAGLPEGTPVHIVTKMMAAGSLEKWAEDQIRDEHGQWQYSGGGARELAGKLHSGGFSAKVLGKAHDLPHTGYMVSPYSKQGKTFVAKTSRTKLADGIRKFKNDNQALLAKENHYLGGWFSKDNNWFALDVSVWEGDLQAAMKLGADNNQEAIYDIVRGVDIPAGGSGMGKIAPMLMGTAVFVSAQDLDDQAINEFLDALLGPELGKSLDLQKHCGVCPEDDEYYQAVIAGEATLDFPDTKHANDVEIVAMMPEGLPAHPALWKPEGGENEVLQTRMGGPQYPREEAAYLLDRSLRFFMVPVGYVAEVNDEQGAAVFYVMGNEPADDLKQYDPTWLEQAAVLDYIMQQTDRHAGNFFTHPDDPGRIILIDNGLGFPSTDLYFRSPFVDAWKGQPLTNDTRAAIQRCLKDAATWTDIADLVGEEACNLARDRAEELAQTGVIPGDIQVKNENTGIDAEGNITEAGSDLSPKAEKVEKPKGNRTRGAGVGKVARKDAPKKP